MTSWVFTMNAEAGRAGGANGWDAVLALSLVAGAVVAVALGVVGRIHGPSGWSGLTFGLPSVIDMKVWFASGAMILGAFQLVTALAMYGKLASRRPPGWVRRAHRLSGRLVILVTLPVAFNCLWLLGLQTTTLRTAPHSLAGSFLYGALTTKILLVRTKRFQGWAVPAAGGAVFTALVALTATRHSLVLPDLRDAFALRL